MELLLTTRAASPFITVLGNMCRAFVELQGALPPSREKEKGKDPLVHPGSGAPSRSLAVAVQSPAVPRAGHRYSLGGARNCRIPLTDWSRWQGWVFLAALTESHLPGNSLQFQGIPSRCSHPQPG